MFRDNKSTLNSMEKNILPRVKSLPLQTQLFFIRLLVISCLVYLLINRASLIRFHLSFSSYKFHPNKYLGRRTGILPLGCSLPVDRDDQQHWKSRDLVENVCHGNTSPMDGMGVHISTYFKRKPLLFVRPMSIFFRWRHEQNFQQSLVVSDTINSHTVDGRNPMKTFEKMVGRISSINSSCREIPLLLTEGYSEMFRRLSRWLILQFLRIIDLPGKLKLEFLFHGPLVESVQFYFVEVHSRSP